MYLTLLGTEGQIMKVIEMENTELGIEGDTFFLSDIDDLDNWIFKLEEQKDESDHDVGD